MGMHINAIVIPEKINPKSDNEVAVFLGTAILPLLRAGYTKQAVIDGLMLAATSAMHEWFVAAKLPHRTEQEANEWVKDVAKRLNNLAADGIQAATTFSGN